MKYFIIVVLICIAWKFSNGNVKDDYFLYQYNDIQLDYAQTSTVKREGDVIKVWTKTVPKEGKIKGYRIGSRIRFKQHEIEKSLLSIKTK